MCNDTTVSKLKNDFHYTLSKFSHELRNPLTLINSGLQMIASAHPDVKEYEHWDDVMDNLDYVKELLDELSSSPRLERVRPVVLLGIIFNFKMALYCRLHIK